MNIKYDLLNEPFFIDYGDICNITIENKLEYRKIIENIYNQETIELSLIHISEPTRPY